MMVERIVTFIRNSRALIVVLSAPGRALLDRLHEDHLRATLLDECPGDLDRLIHLCDQKFSRRLMILESRGEIYGSARIDDADGVSGFRTGGRALFLRVAAIAALHVAPEIHSFTFDGDGWALRLREG